MENTNLEKYKPYVEGGILAFQALTNLIDKVSERGTQVYCREIDFKSAQVSAELEAKLEPIRVSAGVEKAKQKTLQMQEQSKCFQKMIDVAERAYNRKLDFLSAQLQSCDEFFGSQISAMKENVMMLSGKLDEALAKGDTDSFVLVQGQIDRINAYCKEVNEKYMSFHDKLTAAVQLAKLELPNNSNMAIGYSK